MTIQLFPISKTDKIHRNLREADLVEHVIRRREGRLAASGAVVVETGQHTGRSAEDKYIVRDSTTADAIWWDNAKEMSEEQFDRLLSDFIDFARHKELFVEDLFAGANPEHRLNTRIVTEYAWHALFIRHLLRRPGNEELAHFVSEFTVVDLPGFRAAPHYHGTRTETVIACNFTKRLVLIGGTSYAGEIKKSVFSFLNYLLPQKNVMPMHCSANVGKDGTSAVFFGLSGTGKTTLSADPSRELLGDDEHGWADTGIFNFEGGCYAKTIRLSKSAEPAIWDASNRFATVLENVVIDPETRVPDFDDNRLAENARSAYPLEAISNTSPTGVADHPKNIVMLTADAFGVLPPIAKLTPSQAMYHFLSGFTAKVAGTEKGMGSEPKPTFSTCFGAPFMPRHPSVYGNLLRKLIADHNVDCWLVNTGWTGGKYGDGKRMPIAVTRALLDAALSGTLKSAQMRIDPVFGFEVPVALEGVDPKVLVPRDTWANPADYDAMAAKLALMFHENFAKYARYVDADVVAAGPAIGRSKAA
ncbi:phosphoenolpyruvate carboxykinase (ATP) [Hyphomicrobium methylovorum]|uniref:phosphoenolpyruvate carboxykinase n=1 Tax=Hyphomicrobium methylovorum TaxID=84 RepID=UPI0015E780E8|nr:phosphoenolpyruvate carboxykinase [Hyphomicrobium methylovorum]MBA2126609.1 phosphoenolpyruvate carboxykinase (ATP) [Hyphomicrobium methylovorum]